MSPKPNLTAEIMASEMVPAITEKVKLDKNIYPVNTTISEIPYLGQCVLYIVVYK